jgi:hypothetical protein
MCCPGQELYVSSLSVRGTVVKRSRKEVFRVVNLDLQAQCQLSVWLSALDASGLPMRVPAVPSQDIAMSGAISALRQRPVIGQIAGQLSGIGTEPCAAAPALPLPGVDSVQFPASVGGYASAVQRLGRAATNHNSTVKQYATSINAVGGVGTSGPPRRQKPA